MCGPSQGEQATPTRNGDACEDKLKKQ